MRTAARNPSIKIVSLDWLTKACREWRRPDEAPFIIPVEPSRKRKRENGNEPEGYSSQSENDWVTPVPPWVADTDDNDFEQGDGDASPIDNVAEDEWAQMSAEFDDEDFEDSESETASQTGEDTKKRKRHLDVETDSQAGNESDTSTASRGRKKKRREFGRTSSLSHVTTLNSLPTISTELSVKAAPTDKAAEDATNGASPDAEEDEDDDDDWDFTNEVQRALAEAGANK